MKRLLIGLFLVLALSGWGAVYYVDYVGGDDTNNGTSTSTPFQHCPGDDSATDTAAGTTLAAGDTVVFEGGVTYVGRIDCDEDGSSGNPITYISGHVYGRWGSGRAVLDGTGITLHYGNGNVGTINILSAIYITVEGLSFTGTPQASDFDWLSGAIGSVSTTAGNITIENCLISGNTTSNGIFFSGGAAGSADGADDVTVNNCTANGNGGHGVYFRGGHTNLTITNNTINNNGATTASDGIFLGGDGWGTPNTVIIRGNTIYDHAAKGPLLFSGDTVLVEDNYFYDTANSDIGLSIQADAAGSSNITIRNNVFQLQSQQNTGVLSIRSTWDANAVISGVDIYNNTFDCTNKYYTIVIDKGVSTQNPAIENVVIKNNSFDITNISSSKFATVINHDECLSGLDSDYNHYYRSGGSAAQFAFIHGTDGNQTLTQWMALGHDDFTHTHYTDPDLTTSGYPNPGSPLIDVGVDLSGEGFTDDKNGLTRPVGAAWDIGAYEYKAPSPMHDQDEIVIVGGLIDGSWFGLIDLAITKGYVFLGDVIRMKIFWVTLIIIAAFIHNIYFHRIWRNKDGD